MTTMVPAAGANRPTQRLNLTKLNEVSPNEVLKVLAKKKALPQIMMLESAETAAVHPAERARTRGARGSVR